MHLIRYEDMFQNNFNGVAREPCDCQKSPTKSKRGLEKSPFNSPPVGTEPVEPSCACVLWCRCEALSVTVYGTVTYRYAWLPIVAAGLRQLLDAAGLEYTDDIFINANYRNLIHSQVLAALTYRCFSVTYHDRQGQLPLPHTGRRRRRRRRRRRWRRRR